MLTSLLLIAVMQGPTGAALDRYLKESGYQGAVLVAKGGEVVLSQGYGLADREKQWPWTAETYVSIGSITKQFTAAAILKLEAQGKLAVEDTVGKFFADAPQGKRAITLHHLLTHTSGLESDFAGDYEPVERDEYVRRILGSKLRSAPGSEYFYANSGYSLLAAVVEIASGRPYESYLREELLLPAGMRETGYRLPKWSPGRMPVGYRDGKRWGTMFEKPWAKDGPYWALRGNGGIETTLSDLWRWSRALDADAVLPAAQRKKLFTPWVTEGPASASRYGYGWGIEASPWGTKVIGHNGGNGIFSADFRRYVDDGIVVITAASDAGQKAWKASGALARIAHGEVVSAAPPAVTPLGDDARAEVVRAFVAAFNDPDLAAMRAFRAAHMLTREGGPTDEQREQVTRRMKEDFGRLRAEGVLETGAGGMTVRMSDSRSRKLRFRFDFTPENRISALAMEPE
jgi:CubicO group peptidase (beta-lactamase class C family)